MSDYPYSAGIMWPVAWPKQFPEPKVEDLHCTIMYLGEIPDLNFTKEDVFEAIANPVPYYAYATVSGVEWFGLEKNIPVLRLESNFLMEFQRVVENRLAAVGIKSASSFPDYKPHVTVDEETANGPHPATLILTPPQIWWGEERIPLDADFI